MNLNQAHIALIIEALNEKCATNLEVGGEVTAELTDLYASWAITHVNGHNTAFPHCVEAVPENLVSQEDLVALDGEAPLPVGNKAEAEQSEEVEVAAEVVEQSGDAGAEGAGEETAKGEASEQGEPQGERQLTEEEQIQKLLDEEEAAKAAAAKIAEGEGNA